MIKLRIDLLVNSSPNLISMSVFNPPLHHIGEGRLFFDSFEL